MKSDIEIACSAELKEIKQVAESVGIPREEAKNYGRYIAKIPERLIDEEKVEQSNLILVTVVTATKAGIDKTTVSTGLILGLSKIGKKAIVALHESSLRPCFGMRGEVAGGGYTQVLPMEKINLHFTGDPHTIASTHNMISVLLNNCVYQHQADGSGLGEIIWRRMFDVNDRSLHSIITGLGSRANGVTIESGFDITPAPEIIAILRLLEDTEGLRRCIENIMLGFDLEGKPFTVRNLEVTGTITVLLKNVIRLDLVQTTEGVVAFVHDGPFANVTHGCNLILATKMAMIFGSYVVTEAGSGADLGAEELRNIKCHKSGLQPKLTVIVATAQGLKMYSGVSLDCIREPNVEELKEGFGNLDKHTRSLRYSGQTAVVIFNRLASDTDEEVEAIRRHCEEELKVGPVINNAFAEGGESTIDLASLVVGTIEKESSALLQYTYEGTDTVQQKVERMACNLYGTSVATYSSASRKMMKLIEEMSIVRHPVCITKTQYPFSVDPKIYGTISNFEFHIKDIVINGGAEMLVAIADEILHISGLSKTPQVEHIDIVDENIEELS